jgi:hypothetical protein
MIESISGLCPPGNGLVFAIINFLIFRYLRTSMETNYFEFPWYEKALWITLYIGMIILLIAHGLLTLLTFNATSGLATLFVAFYIGKKIWDGPAIQSLLTFLEKRENDQSEV